MIKCFTSQPSAESQNQTVDVIHELEHKLSASIQAVQQKLEVKLFSWMCIGALDWRWKENKFRHFNFFFQENEQSARSTMAEMGAGLQTSVKQLEVTVAELKDRVAHEAAIAKV